MNDVVASLVNVLVPVSQLLNDRLPLAGFSQPFDESAATESPALRSKAIHTSQRAEKGTNAMVEARARHNDEAYLFR